MIVPPGALGVELGGQQLLLLPERAVFRLADQTLFVADLHIGKAAAFRSQGVAVPPGTTGETLERLDQLIATTAARRLVVLGDFLHSAAGRQPRTENRLAQWRAARGDVLIDLIRGNHDRGAGDPGLGIRAHNAPHPDSELSLFHLPPAAHPRPWLAGHVHPGVRLVGAGRQRTTVPCFHRTAGGIVLPAFGAFTGLGIVRVGAGDQVFAIAHETIVEVQGRHSPPNHDPSGFA